MGCVMVSICHFTLNLAEVEAYLGRVFNLCQTSNCSTLAGPLLQWNHIVAESSERAWIPVGDYLFEPYAKAAAKIGLICIARLTDILD